MKKLIMAVMMLIGTSAAFAGDSVILFLEFAAYLGKL